jgi:ADP-ribose pyrophosphatase
VHLVPLVEADSWLQARAAEGYLIDPKVYAGLYFLGRESAGQQPPAGP